MNPTILMVESQVDWLTATSRRDEPQNSLARFARHCIAGEQQYGNQTRAFSMKGYEGWICGRARWGLRPGGTLLSLSGDLADKSLAAILLVADNISRIDLAVTCEYLPPRSDVEAVAWMDYLNWTKRRPDFHQGSLVQSADGGATCYMGSRTSEAMLRIYNKEVESRLPRYRGCHRWELEIKGGRSLPIARDVAAQADPANYVRDAIYSYCARHGYIPDWEGRADMCLRPGFRRRSDANAKLDWLRSAVSPTVAWLREFGYQAELYRALGWDEITGVPLVPPVVEISDGSLGVENIPPDPVTP